MSTKESDERPVGLTRQAGFEIGVRRTLPVRCEDAWQFLTSDAGVRIWLGDASGFQWTEGAAYQLADGAIGRIRVFTPNSHLRLTWHPPDWPRASTIQVRVIPRGNLTVVAFHQEHLPGLAEREERRAYYTTVLDALERVFRSR